MSANKRYLYYVEGETEKKLIQELMKEKTLIVPGTVRVLNVTEKRIPNVYLKDIPNNTIVILVFDTDRKETGILKENIKRLRNSKTVKDIWFVMQVENLEDELKRSTDIKQMKDLIGCKSNKDFKREFLKERRLIYKLNNHSFDIDKLWSSKPSQEYKEIENMGKRIKKT
jgi:exoribonuclease II